MADDRIGSFREERFPLSRTPTMDVVQIGKAMHHIPILLEVDVTAARTALARRKSETGRDLSFTGWVIKCLAQAVSEHKRVQARRRGRRKLVIFDDVDVSLVAFRRVAGEESRERLPMPFVVRRANEKTLDAIDAEIKAAQAQPLGEGQQVLETGSRPTPKWLMRMFFAVPYWLRKWLVWDRLLHDPVRAKREMGTVMVTSVAASTRGAAWAIPAGIHPLIVALGSVARKPGVVESGGGRASGRAAAAGREPAVGEEPAAGSQEPPEAAGGEPPSGAGGGGLSGAGSQSGVRFEARDMLSLTIMFDHDVVDGVPVALFLKRLTDLMESAAFV